jgi:Bacterial DNA polymerase III alpha NTPase domain/Type III restriction enzyme, res subunit/Bacterial DNA polymerase III alpha subunit finger domain
MSLRPNQLRAINETVSNDFESGIHYHATGSGKSWIAMHIIAKFYKKYPTSNIMWICEKKSILIEQFNTTVLKERGFQNIFNIYNVLNYSDYKLVDWHNSVNSGIFWTKPILLVINRAFLTSNDKYKKIKAPFHLIIHDECHTIINHTTRQFYDYMLHQPVPPKCIGFSATPNQTYAPYKQILTSYSIYDAFMDDVIVPPKIKWFSCDDPLEQTEIVHLIKEQIEQADLKFRKIIVWCGMIELCEQMAKLWSTVFKDYTICIDMCKPCDSYASYEEFNALNKQAILFCAAKHREGSDIKHLDCCVFLDKVDKRCPKVFLQCIGRVLRIDKQKQKTFGLVIDVQAKSSLTICNNLNQYLNLPADVFPWTYNYDIKIHNKKMVKINDLMMIKYIPNQIINPPLELSNTIQALLKLFVRNVPKEPQYTMRLMYELDMLHTKNLICHLMQAMQILHLTKHIPHVTRGSCGSSLVCYMLGISHVDPVKNNIKFARFLTTYRSNLPDIDLDFPHNLRDEVFLKIGLTWPGKVARISNHVYYHDKSALRQAIRNAGIHKFIGKYEVSKELNKLSFDTKRAIMQEKNALENTFRCYSLHCGGIVYYPEGIPSSLLLEPAGQMNRGALKQVMMNKHDVSKEKNFKIDILSSRALSQCYEANKYLPIAFEDFVYDKKTFDMLHRGDNIGIILAESPLMRKAFLQVKPKDLYGLAICLSIIRPAAMDARQCIDTVDFNDHIIFDDDAIDIIGKYINVDDEEADKFRRAFAKCDKRGIEEFRNRLQAFPREKQRDIMSKLANLSQYGFCKSHALSYAQLIWKLAYMKANHPYEFWKATLNNCQSMYRRWVHLYEAKLAGIDYTKQNLKRDDVSIYATNRRRKIEIFTPVQQLQKYGYWVMNDNSFFPGCYYSIKSDGCHYFNGIIASSRITKHKKGKKLMLFIGVGSKQYIQVNIESVKFFDSRKVGIEGMGRPLTEVDKQCSIISTIKYHYY